MKLSVYIAASLDGFIARENGDVDWLECVGSDGDAEDYGFQDFFSSVSCLVMGRNTFEKVLTFGRWPYEGKRVVVMTRSLKTLPVAMKGKVELFSTSPEALVDKLNVENETHLYIDGGRLIQSFLRSSLVDEINISYIPILLGRGIPLFGSLDTEIRLKHANTKAYPTGLVQSKYLVPSGDNQPSVNTLSN